MDADRHPSANASQRARRQRLARIDYHPSEMTLALIKQRMGPRYPLNIYSGAIDAIVEEWAELAGINKGEIFVPMSSGAAPEFSDANACASDFGDFLRPTPPLRPVCGAKRRRDGESCQGRPVPGKLRCKWHGGCSTGPRTPDGKARARDNLRQFRPRQS